jgi:hypothetical protein
LAETVLAAPPVKSVPAPNLLLEQEPAYRVFLGNLIDILRPPRTAPLKRTSLPGRFWPDVFVPARLPWERFVQSIALHVVTLAALGAALEFGIAQPHLRHANRRTFNGSDVIYYLPSEYLQQVRKEGGPLRSPQIERSRFVRQRAIAVSRDSRSSTPAAIGPPNVKLKEDLHQLRLVSWNATMPAVPFSATIRNQLNTPAATVVVVAPPPDIPGLAQAQALIPATQVVIEPAPSVPRSIRQNGSISIGHMEVVGPAPYVAVYEQAPLSGMPQATLGSATTSVVPPPPSIASLGNPGQHISSPMDASIHIVPPPPLLPHAGSYLRAAPNGRSLIVPPPPSVEGLGDPGGRHISSAPAVATRVVPPAPLLQGGGAYARDGSARMAISAVPPPPSVNGVGRSDGPRMSSLRDIERQIAPLPSVQTDGDGIKSRGPVTLASGPPGGLLPGEIIADVGQTVTDVKQASETKALSVNFIEPALVLPRSTYFLSYEVFIAEERLTRHESRLIKLVYDFLPYQPRLSDYGPNYPAIENLRATRDPSCDETLMQVASAANTARWSQADRVQFGATSLKQRQNTLPCYRTTADDYRRARARQHR